MTKSFADQIKEMVDENIRALEGVAKLAIQDVVNRAQLQGPSKANPAGGKGGDMPVDTGFLRASGAASLQGWPSGAVNKPQGIPRNQLTYTYNGEDTSAVLAKLKLGDTFYFGWTAEYAVKLNVQYGFQDKAVQNWQSYVAKHAENARKRKKK